MIKRILERWAIFYLGLRVFAAFGKMKWYRLASAMSGNAAKLNLTLNKPTPATTPSELGKQWMSMMPPDAKEKFAITSTDDRTAYGEIRIHCPLRGSGDASACYHLMNYDRTLMERVGGQLVVLESQSLTNNDHCKVAIRAQDDSVDDLIPAHVKMGQSTLD